ncbi:MULTISPECIES: TonB-dependent receptor domain-containing protein [Sphingobacterium]|uniref:TonB-dependent receptor domain-containing protein n=1 Tax=Sphingobacterium TaxID=28453 RepID=UPI0008A47B52|nr:MULTISPECIES: TonB-dependent receptor [Sphingobacterium]OFV20195.1 TonB-dependent receptor [Sphingobacterium sp. HMSC13C05]OJZ10824.1 MAG: TonB-dependent receptor [Sphingobacterium sp. 40-24]QQT63895.1 TonB-dependent receptor [Sphingobacterium multivorum]HAU52874.1 TonB-dependent receptor [Sphingobacterium sp.]
MKRYFYLLLLNFLITSFAYAQVKVTGKVHVENNVPLASATAYLMKAKTTVILKAVVTDENGEYQFSDIQAGSYYVEAKMVGYTTNKSNVFDISKSDHKVPAILLNTDTRKLQEVAVEGKRPMVESKPGKLVLNVENSPLAAGNNALDIVQRAPGVSLDNNNNLQLMGQSGVSVTIDGRQTYMSGEQLVNFLKSTDGNQIKSVEVITTRAAKDDAEGAVGTINIVLKKNRMEGFNGTFNMTAGRGEKFRGNSSLSLNYKKNNTTVFGSYAYSDEKSHRKLLLDRVIQNKGEKTYFKQRSILDEKEQNHSYRFGVEQRTSARNTLTVQFNGSNNIEYNDNDSKTNVGKSFTTLDSLLISTSQFKELFDRYSANLNNEFRIDSNGRKLTLDLDWSKFKSSKRVGYNNQYFDGQMNAITPEEIQRSRMPIGIDIYVAKLDYEQPLSKVSKLEMGAKYSNVTSDNDLTFEDFLNNSWINNEKRTNHFVYKEQIAAGYIDYNNTIGKWGLKVGARGEYTFSDGNSLTLNKQVKRNYFKLFPNANLTYTLHENHILSLGYARKITRPNYRQLNPFDYFIDKLTFERGNPYLNPQFSNEFTLNYTLMQRYNVTLGINDVRDAIVESMGQDSVLKQTWVIRENLGKNLTAYLNLNIPVTVSKIWSMNNNITGIHFNFDGMVSGYPLKRTSFLLQATSMHNLKLAKSLSANVNLRYFSPFNYNVYDMKARWDMEVGATKTFKDQRSSLKLAVSDLFNTGNQNLKTNFGDFDSSIRQYQDRRVVRLTYSYKFGNLKNNYRKKDTSNEEKERAQ